MKSSYELPLAFGMANGPQLLPTSEINACRTYREAVRLCWLHRRSQGMTKATLAEYADLYTPHVSDYLSANPDKRELPAKRIAAFESVCGNYAITQWLNRQSGLHLVEEMLQAA